MNIEDIDSRLKNIEKNIENLYKIIGNIPDLICKAVTENELFEIQSQLLRKK